MITVFTKEKALELRKNYQAIETIWKFVQNRKEPLKKDKDFKEALEIVKERGLNTALYDDCLSNWDTVRKDVGEIVFNIEKTVDAETATKLRLVVGFIVWPMTFSQIAKAVMYSQHWFFTRPPKDTDLLPIELEPISPEEFKRQNFIQGDWLEENFFTTSNELARAIIYGEDCPYEYNLQDLPPVKSLLKKIKVTSTKWGEAAREAAKKDGFIFDKDVVGDYQYAIYERERLALAYEAAPEELRNEHIKAVRQLTKEVWKYHKEKLQGQEFSTLPSTSVTKIAKQILNNPTRIGTTKKGEITSERHYMTRDIVIKYKNSNNDLTFTMERAKELFTQKAQKGTKVFNFLLKKLNEQNYREQTTFLVSELVDAGIYANKDSAKKGLTTIAEKMYCISLEGRIRCYQSGKKETVPAKKSRIISAYEDYRGKWNISFAPIIREAVTAITILPDWANKLNDRSYHLLDYIFYLARQNAVKIKETGKFNVSLNAVATYMALPTPEEANRSNHNILIKEPIMKSIEEIERARPNTELKITPYYNLEGNIHDFLAGRLEIEVDKYTQGVMTERALVKESEIKKKKNRIEKAKQKQLEKKLKEANQPETAMG